MDYSSINDVVERFRQAALTQQQVLSQTSKTLSNDENHRPTLTLSPSARAVSGSKSSIPTPTAKPVAAVIPPKTKQVLSSKPVLPRTKVKPQSSQHPVARHTSGNITATKFGRSEMDNGSTETSNAPSSDPSKYGNPKAAPVQAPALSAVSSQVVPLIRLGHDQPTPSCASDQPPATSSPPKPYSVPVNSIKDPFSLPAKPAISNSVPSVQSSVFGTLPRSISTASSKTNLESAVVTPKIHVNIDAVSSTATRITIPNPVFDRSLRIHVDELRVTPLFSEAVKSQCCPLGSSASTLPQYGLLGERLSSPDREDLDLSFTSLKDRSTIYANMNEPWSTFICGSQGSGKSHTLSCLLENALLEKSCNGLLPNPMTAVVFHYDKFSSTSTTQLCEAAYLCSAGIEVRVLVSPSNIWAMQKMYTNLPGLPANSARPKVMPLYLRESQLNITNIMTLMAVSKNTQPLYLEVLYNILREMRMESRGHPGLNYAVFKERLKQQQLLKVQSTMLGLRLQLLESFLEPGDDSKYERPAMPKEDIWKFKKGCVTIIDLSCPFMNEADACALFSICLSIFLEERGDIGRVVALDEAHKFLTQSGEAAAFTDQLTCLIRQQRHLATRVIIATQEPTLSPALLDLSNVTIVHRFQSPKWFVMLQGHLAAVKTHRAKKGDEQDDIFQTIVALETGEALIFSPTSILDTTGKLQQEYFKIRVRERLTTDGGRSLVATEKFRSSKMVEVEEIEMFQPLAMRQAVQPPLSRSRISAKPANIPAPPINATVRKLAPATQSKYNTSVKLTNMPATPANSKVRKSAPAPQKSNVATPEQIRSELKRQVNLNYQKGWRVLEGFPFEWIREATQSQVNLPSRFLYTEAWLKESKEIIKAELACLQKGARR